MVLGVSRSLHGRDIEKCHPRSHCTEEGPNVPKHRNVQRNSAH